MLLKKLMVSYNILFVLICFSSCDNTLSKNVFIKRLYVVNPIDSSEDRGKMLTYKRDAFIIHDFKRNKLMNAYVDSFVEKIKEGNSQLYSQHTITFYKYLKYTNTEYLKQNPRALVRYSNENDCVYSYIFFNGILNFFEYKNGKIIYPISNVTVE